MSTPPDTYAARLDIDYPDRLDRLTTFFRLIWAIPILIILGLLTATGNETVATETGEQVTATGGGIAGGLFGATLLMILFRQRYPAVVVRLRPRTHPLRGPHRRLPGAAHRPLPIHGRRAGGAPGDRLPRRRA